MGRAVGQRKQLRGVFMLSCGRLSAFLMYFSMHRGACRASSCQISRETSRERVRLTAICADTKKPLCCRDSKRPIDRVGPTPKLNWAQWPLAISAAREAPFRRLETSSPTRLLRRLHCASCTKLQGGKRRSFGLSFGRSFRPNCQPQCATEMQTRALN